jgi:biopolymer transport protein TolQ
MIIYNKLVAINPFFTSYHQSDLFGKAIFIGLFTLSVLTWIILIYKVLAARSMRKNATQFRALFEGMRHHPLGIDQPPTSAKKNDWPNPFWEVYKTLKKRVLEVLNKNRSFGESHVEGGRASSAFLSTSDIDLVATCLEATMAEQSKQLEKNLFVLSTIVSLGPFLGLLGTVWGILVSFMEMTSQGAATQNSAVLGGLSMALATTVLGLLVAIPALIAYNYLKATSRDFSGEMQEFSTLALAAVEIHYRKVDVD